MSLPRLRTLPPLPDGLLDGVPQDVVDVIDSLPQHRLLKTGEVAAILRVTTKTVVQWCEADELTYTRTPGLNGAGAYRVYRTGVIRMLIRDCRKDFGPFHRITTAGGSPPDPAGSQLAPSGGDTLPPRAADEHGT